MKTIRPINDRPWIRRPLSHPVWRSIRSWAASEVVRRLCMMVTFWTLPVAAIGGCASVFPASAEQSRSATLMQLLEAEMRAGLDRRVVRGDFDTYQAWTANRLDESAGDKTWSDKTGNCRLAWVDGLLRDQLNSPVEAERLSWRTHQSLHDEVHGLSRVLREVATRLDAEPYQPPPRGLFWPGHEPGLLLSNTSDAIHQAFERAMALIDAQQLQLLREKLYEVTTDNIKTKGAFTVDRDLGRQISDILERMNRTALHEAATHIAVLSDPRVLALLSRIEFDETPAPIETSAGKIGIFGREPTIIDLNQMADYCMVVDLGGDDQYIGGATTADRPVMVIIDLGGNDTYKATQPGVQGGAMLGVSVVIDVEGDDTYDALDIAQGSCVGGVGMLIDMGGNDSYRARRRAQGSAFFGIAVLVDRNGGDRYHAALWAQGFGGTYGFGLLDDLHGDDHYYAGGLYKDAYDDTPGYAGWSQGVGAGPRAVANGGIGMLLDGDGDDVYECDYFSHGGGYWFAIGIARDFAGNDQRLGSTRLAWDGNQREEKVFLRWGIGWQAHYALGFTFDDAGDDTYGGDIVGLGFSWDIGVAGLFDFGGDDDYQVASVAQGQGAQAAMGILFDVGGDDTFAGSQLGTASPSISYHPLPQCGGNFGFGVNYEGDDTYGDKAQSDVYLEVASPRGFLIDRASVPSIEKIHVEAQAAINPEDK